MAFFNWAGHFSMGLGASGAAAGRALDWMIEFRSLLGLLSTSPRLNCFFFSHVASTAIHEHCDP
jgi:hypothetical protein